MRLPGASEATPEKKLTCVDDTRRLAKPLKDIGVELVVITSRLAKPVKAAEN